MKKLKSCLFAILTVLVLLYLFMVAPTLNPLYYEGAFFWAVLITAYVGLFALLRTGELTFQRIDQKNQVPFNYVSKQKFPKWAVIVIMLAWAYIVLMTIVFSFIFQWGAFRDQLGEPQVKKFSSEIQAVDTTQIPVVDKSLAKKLAEKKLGERPSLGSQTVVGIPTIQSVDGKLVWVVPLHHSGFFKWLMNMEGTPGYIVVSATNINDVDYVEGFKIKYHPDSYLLHDAKRQVRFKGNFLTGIDDYSFELDDNGQPYWVVTTYHNLRGFNLPEADGAILLNATTGETQRYTLETLPKWVDRVQPEDFVINQINNKGRFVHGIFNFSNKDKYTTSNGHNIVYNNGDCYLFTGLTSVGTDESALGFIMVDMVTKESFLYQMSGATEEAAQRSAEGKVQHLGYYATFPIILNIDGNPTYFMALKDNEGLVKQYAMVSILNYSTVGNGETMASAIRSYRSALQNDGVTGELTQDAATADLAEISGTVVRIASEVQNNSTTYKLILSEQPSVIYLIDSVVSEQLALTQPGDHIALTYNYNGMNSDVYVAEEFHNLTIGKVLDSE